MQQAPYPGFPPQPPVAPKRGMPRWLVVLLITLGVGFVLVCILGVLAVAGVRKYLSAAKQAEARGALGQLARDEASAFERPLVSGRGKHGLCPSATSPVPARPEVIYGRKYQSSPADWKTDAKIEAGFSCLGFEMDSPQYYMYSYRASGRIAPGDSFTATANGDLDGDRVLSTFTISGKVGPRETLTLDPAIHEEHPDD